MLRAITCALSWFALSCASASVAEAADAPVSPDEPRAELHFVLDLPRRGDCEQVFDLALYESRVVDLVMWDPTTTGCTDRKVTVRYLSQKASSSEMIDKVKSLAAKATVVP